jgi:anti-sigma-K factor RskA
MSGNLRLVDRNPQRPHIQSPAELQAYVRGRLDARARYNEQESERRDAEQALWRKKAHARRQNVQFAVFVVAYLALVAGCVYLLFPWPR